MAIYTHEEIDGNLINNSAKNEKYITFTAFDKNSSANFQKTYYTSRTEDDLLGEFEKEVPFTKWYYEVEID